MIEAQPNILVGPIKDPSLDPEMMLPMRHETLAQRDDVENIDLAKGAREYDLSEMQPLGLVGEYGLVGSINAGGDKKLEVWGKLDETGRFDKRGVIVVDEDLNPIDVIRRGEADNTHFVSVFAGHPEKVIGRSMSPDEQAKLGTLPTTVSRKHLGISVDESGRIIFRDHQSTNGTELIVGKPDLRRRPIGDEGLGALAPASVVEKVKDPRLVQLLAPIKTIKEFTEENPGTQTNYDYMFMDDGPERDAIIEALRSERTKRQAEESNHTIVTEESRAAASRQLGDVRRNDDTINNMLRDYEQKHPGVTDLVEAIRTDSDLRYKIGEHLLNAIMPIRLQNMPERIRDNSQKKPNHSGYGHLRQITSREYATLLALAMIDGTYQGYGKGDEIDRHPDTGRVIRGQHRAAALGLLN